VRVVVIFILKKDTWPTAAAYYNASIRRANPVAVVGCRFQARVMGDLSNDGWNIL